MFHPQQQIGPYTLIRLLGRGGFGEVWLAEKSSALMTSQVAVKLPLDPNPDLEAIRREAQTWLRASGHPNVLPVIESDIYNGQVVIVSEYAAGGSLSSWLEQHGGKAPSVEAAVAMTSGILAGLEYLHTLKPEPIIHRDLKPDNILLQGGLPRLTDFGISRVLKTTEQTKYAAGTPHYMPPEAFAGRYSPQSDVWAVGVMLYQMLSGNLPFPQSDMPSLYGAILTGAPAPLPAGVPDSLRKAVMRALEKEPSRRPQSAAAMRVLLNPPPQPLPSPPSRRSFLWGIGAAGAGACGLYAYNHYQKERTKTDDTHTHPGGNQAGTGGAAKISPDKANGTESKTKTNTIDDAEMARIPTGLFSMGSNNGSEDEKPVHLVSMFGFWMYKTPVTVAQFRKYDEANGRSYDWTRNRPSWGWLDDHPMVNVSWTEASSYAKWAGGALPTEAQWEYAARGGLESKNYPWGDDWDGRQCANSVKPNALQGTKEVKSYPANGYGLYDMAGNVWQWCADYYDKDYMSEAAKGTNPTGPLSGSVRVLRGGSWNDYSEAVFRCANRLLSIPVLRLDGTGFRCCMVAQE